MGCGSSANKVHVVTVASTDNCVDNKTQLRSPVKTPASAGSRKGSSARDRRRGSKKVGDSQAWGSQESLRSRSSLGEGDGEGPRGHSATSKNSHHSMDSGFSDVEYARVVTEFSQPEKIKEVEENFETPRNLDLGVTGQSVPQRNSAKDKSRLEEQRVIASLRDEGLIQRPVSRAACGMSFEIVADNSGMFGDGRRPPPRLAKLEKRRKTKRPLTEEEIQRKLERAERKKKELEQQRLAKIAALNKSDVLTALDSFASRQREQEQHQKSKEETAAENREKKLIEMRDKLKAKQEHAEAVRRRKQVEPIQIADSPRNGSISSRSLPRSPLLPARNQHHHGGADTSVQT